VIAREQILGLIPHAGRMCLLDRVIAWDAQRVHCESSTHLDADNPLREAGRLSAIHLIEYAAQAMAIHGGLLARDAGEVPAGAGVLAALRDIELKVAQLDDITAPLQVVAHRRIAGAGGSIYEFAIHAGDVPLASGRLSVMPGGHA
jgi:predicted hotdog family 3-hydroxylacyl-ACP dehydratase